MELKGKKVTVMGLARSGVGSANLLSAMGAEVIATDIRSREELTDSIKKLLPSVVLALKGHPDYIFESADMVIVSPGVPLEINPIVSAKANDISVIGELELAYQIIQNVKKDKQIPFFAVTGSNGKSTTTTLLDLMLMESDSRTLLAGNIGNALTEEIYKIISGKHKTIRSLNDINYFVTEVSSFQLEAIDTFRPHIASILNITPDHLDRYHSMAEYSDAKAQIFLNQQNTDFLVLNADDPETMKVKSEKLKVKSLKPKIIYFSRKNKVEGIYYRDGQIYCNLPESSQISPHSLLISADELNIKGVHNLENAMAASAMALLADCPVDAVTESLRKFKGLEHRLELVRELDGVKYFNDSKGTNIGAVIKSLKSFYEPLILIAGGRDKAGDFSALRDLVDEKVKTLVLIGEASIKIRDALTDVTDIVMAKGLEDAVRISHDIAAKGDVVLLSPACASFDMFQDFEDRGRQFKKIIMELDK